MQVFIAVLFITEEIWKPPKCPSTDEWLKTLRCIQKMNYCLVKKISNCDLQTDGKFSKHFIKCKKQDPISIHYMISII